MTDLIRLSELARRSGVPGATIKHYVREGLLPGPTLKTGRTMAYYNPALVSRVKAIKELQQKRFLPLSVIAQVLAGADPYRADETEAALSKALAKQAPAERRSHRELIDGGVAEEQLDFFESVGFITPVGQGASRSYEGDDLALLRTLAAARRAGLSPEMLPHTIVAPYVAAIRELVRVELEMFRAGVKTGDADRDIEALVDTAAKLSERLVTLLRRKLLLPVLRELVDDETRAQDKDRSERPVSNGRME